jgi:uncharacterized protein (TIGR03083 family)
MPGPMKIVAPGVTDKSADKAALAPLDELLAAVYRSHDRLAAPLANLPPDGLGDPSYHSWSIGQVLSHLGSGAEIFRLYVEAGSAGTPVPTIDDFHPVWDRWNAMTRVEQRDGFLVSDLALLDAFAAVPAGERDGWRLEMFGAQQTLSTVARMRLGEHTLHSWDVLVALDPAATLPLDAVDLMVDSMDPLVERFGKTDQPIGTRLELTDPDRSFVLETGPDGGTLAPAGDHDRPSGGTLGLPAEAFIRLLYGRLDPDHTPSSVSTDGADLDLLRRAFPGV